MTQPSVALVLTTVADSATARTLARSLISQRLVACATLVPVESIYRWEGDVEEAAEIQLILKTDSAGVSGVREAIEQSHPYDLPEVLVLDAGASAAYGAWVAAEVAH